MKKSIWSVLSPAFLGLAAFLGGETEATAEDYYLQATQGPGFSWNSIANATGTNFWQSGEAVTAGNSYYVGKTGVQVHEWVLRAPDNANPAASNVFPGAKLTIGFDENGTAASGSLGLKCSATVNDLVLYSGAVTNSKSPGAQVTLAGNVTVTGTGAAFYSSGENATDTRSLFVTAKISGAAGTALSFTTTAAANVFLLNPANDFAGTITIAPKANVGLFNPSAPATVGKLGTDTVTLISRPGSKLSINQNLTVASWQACFGHSSAFQMAMPSVTVSDAMTQKKLAAAGIQAPIGTTITVTGSTRTAATYYLCKAPNDQTGWEDAAAWSTVSASGAASGLVPTIGDTAHISQPLRLKFYDANKSNATQYFLAKTYLDKNGTLALKDSASSVVCIPELILNGGGIGNWVGGTTILDGGIFVQANSTIANDPIRGVEIRSNISGSANISVTNSSSAVGTVCNLRLKGSNTDFTGNWNVGVGVWLEAAAGNSLGRGNVSLAGSNQLVVSGAQTIGTLTVADTADAQATSITVNGPLTATVLSVTAASTTLSGTGSVTTDQFTLNPAANRTSNFRLNGGTLNALSVVRGTNAGSSAVFTLADGMLNVGTWGTEAAPLDLTQSGGTLTTSGSELVFSGDFTQTGGTVKLDLASQKLVLKGDAAILRLSLDAVNGFQFDENTIYEVMEFSDPTAFDFSKLQIEAVGNLAGNSLIGRIQDRFFYVGTHGAIGNALPEPAAWLILLLGSLGLLSWKRLRK